MHDGRIVLRLFEELKIFNLQTSKYDCTFKIHSCILCFAVLSDDRIIIASDNNTLNICNPHTERCEDTFVLHDQNIRCITVLSSGLVIIGSDDHTLKLWNLQTKECERTFEGCHNQTNCIAKMPDKRIISGSNDGTLCIWNIPTGNCYNTFDLYSTFFSSYPISCISVLHDSRLVIGS